MDKEEKEVIKYAPVSISKISSDITLPADIYLLISDKYIKFKNRGDQISSEKFNFFLAHDLKKIYITFSELPVFMEWIKVNRFNSINESVSLIGEEHRKIAEKREEIKERLYETLADKEISSETVAVLKNSVSEFIVEIQKLDEPEKILAALLKQNTSIAEHSANVANLAIFIALVLGFGRQFQLENIYIGALLHDYGKAKIPPTILENQDNIKYSQAIQDHPLKGANMLEKSKNIQEQVIRIVKEHHEQYNGKGYPNGLARDEIYDLSRVVAMANIIDEEMQRKKVRNADAYRRVAKFLTLDSGKRFDPIQAAKVSKAMLLAFPKS